MAHLVARMLDGMGARDFGEHGIGCREVLDDLNQKLGLLAGKVDLLLERIEVVET